MNHKIQEIVAEIEAVRQAVYEAVEPLSQVQLDFKPAPERWSISENLSHLNKVERGLPKLYALLLQKLESAGWQPETEGSMLRSLDGTILAEDGPKFQAPERVLPVSGLSKAEVLAALQQSRQAVLDAVAPAPEYDLSGVLWPHPALGDINFYQWVLFIGKHEARHLQQIQTIQQSVDFPAH
ncbi:MAG: DinB family protein [Blastocatellia bacterium]